MRDEIVPVRENLPLTGSHFLLTVESPWQAQAARPGQFVMLRLLGRSDILLRRPMSIFDVVGEGSPTLIRLLYKTVGRGTDAMARLKSGDRVGLLAPLGHGFFREDYQKQLGEVDEVVHLAGGIGIAALLTAARELSEQNIPQRLFHGGRSAPDLVGWEDFRPYVTDTILATEDGSRGHKGFVTAPFEDDLKKNREKRVLMMVCGPEPMLKACAALARDYGHPCLISMENRMGCGVGVCLGCSVSVDGTGHGAYERVCTEGPVFWAEHLNWNTGT
ncbi:MAG: dihydroorotate dehydrogenase electron transfer subunit [Acidobacteria bacterium]|nr:dihydroorotate dehydrogenase electron transfer subunit [Acidobacteriota bacterium]